MGRIIANKVRGMNWMAKISLVMIFTLVFSTFMWWYQPRETRSAITNNGWTTIYNNTAYPNNSSVAYTVPAGSNRLLMVMVASERTTSGTQTYTISYGNQALTEVTAASDRSNATPRQHTAIYYLDEAGI